MRQENQLCSAAGCRPLRYSAACTQPLPRFASNPMQWNEGEAKAVMEHVRRLMAAGISPADIGIITPYNAQVGVLQQLGCQPQLERAGLQGVGLKRSAACWTPHGLAPHLCKAHGVTVTGGSALRTRALSHPLPCPGGSPARAAPRSAVLPAGDQHSGWVPGSGEGGHRDQHGGWLGGAAGWPASGVAGWPASGEGEGCDPHTSGQT